MTQPQLSAVFNNCALHSILPELKVELFKFAQDELYDNQHKEGYEHLKTKFAEYYGFDPASFTWKQLANILRCYNHFDTEVIMGPVLRLFMKDTIAPEYREHNQPVPILWRSFDANEQAQIANIVDEIKREISKLTELSPIANYTNYNTLAPDELYRYVAKHLGFGIHANHNQREIIQSVPENPLANITIFLQGGGQFGDEVGGHWERTDKKSERINYRDAEDTQLNKFILLCETPNSHSYGMELLKNHVQLTQIAAETGGNLTREFAKLYLSEAQIEYFLLSSVDKGIAKTKMTEEFTKNNSVNLSISEGIAPPAPPTEDMINADLNKKRTSLYMHRVKRDGLAIQTLPQIYIETHFSDYLEIAKSAIEQNGLSLEFINKQFDNSTDYESYRKLVVLATANCPDAEAFIIWDYIQKALTPEEPPEPKPIPASPTPPTLTNSIPVDPTLTPTDPKPVNPPSTPTAPIPGTSLPTPTDPKPVDPPSTPSAPIPGAPLLTPRDPISPPPPLPQTEENLHPCHIEYNSVIHSLLGKMKEINDDPNYKKDSTLQAEFEATQTLHGKLHSAGFIYFTNPKPTPDLYQKFKDQIKKSLDDAKTELGNYRGWDIILANIAAMVITAGVGYLLALGVNYAINKRVTFFETTREKEVEDMRDLINKIGPKT